MGQFMTPGEHFDKLLATLTEEDLALYRGMRNTRPEAAYRNRSFVVYEIVQREPLITATINILDFVADDADGATCEVIDTSTRRTMTVGYTPVRLFDFPIFVHLPLHGKLRWSTIAEKPNQGSLAFDIIIRCQSRNHLRERGVVYCESGINYAREFEGAKV